MHRKTLPYNSKLKSLARALRKDMTFSEVLLWNELKQKKMLAIEVDGISHDFEEVRDNDEIRQKRLEDLGVNFLRFNDRKVKRDMANMLRIIGNWILEQEEKKPE